MRATRSSPRSVIHTPQEPSGEQQESTSPPPAGALRRRSCRRDHPHEDVAAVALDQLERAAGRGGGAFADHDFAAGRRAVSRAAEAGIPVTNEPGRPRITSPLATLIRSQSVSPKTSRSRLRVASAALTARSA